MKRIALPTGLLLVVMLTCLAMLRARAQDEFAKPILADGPPVPTLPDPLQPPSPDGLDPVSPTDPVLIDPAPVEKLRPNVRQVPKSHVGRPGETLQESDGFARPPASDPAPQSALKLKIVSLRTLQAKDAVRTLHEVFNDGQAVIAADERSNSVILRGREAELEELIALLEQLDSAESPELRKTLTRRIRSDDEVMLEKRVLELKTKFDDEGKGSTGQKTKNADTRLQELAEQIRSAVDESFNERQRQQLAEIDELTARLNKLAKAVREREAKRESIIEERISELIGGGHPPVGWKSDHISEPFRSREGTPKGIPFEEPPGVSLLFFTASNAATCQQMEPIIESLQRDGLHVRRFDITGEHEAIKRFSVDRIPTIIIRFDNKTAKTIVGKVTNSDLRAAVNAELEMRGDKPFLVDDLDNPDRDEKTAAPVRFVAEVPDFAPNQKSTADSELVKLARSLTAAADAVRFYKSNLAELEKAGVSSPNDSVNLSSARRGVTSVTGSYQQTLEDCLTHKKLLTIELKRAQGKLDAAKLRAETMRNANALSTGAYNPSEIQQAELQVVNPQADVDRLQVLMDLFRNIEQETTIPKTKPPFLESKIDDLAPKADERNLSNPGL